MIEHIIFDFDNTLFDTEKRKAYFYHMAEIHGYSRAEAKAVYQKARLDGDRIAISLASFMRSLREKVVIDGKEFLSEEVSEIIQRMDKGPCLVPFARELLKNVADKNIDRHVLTLGVRGWQEEKIRISGIRQYIPEKNIHIVEGTFNDKLIKVRELFGDDCTGKGILWVDDKPTEAGQALRAFPDMRAFVRFEQRDERFKEEDMLRIVEEFGQKVQWSTTLRDATVLITNEYEV